MGLKAIIRTILVRCTPESVWKPLLKQYYFHRIRSYSQDTKLENRAKELRVIKNLIIDGDTVIDIGSNFGFYTLFLSKVVGKSGCVYSIEPIPLTFEILSYNIKKLGLGNVKLLNCAISEKNGITEMEIPEYDSGGESFYLARVVNDINKAPSLRKYSVVMDTLDYLFLDLSKRISFIKIDVEGHELPVIMGAEKVISRFLPALLIEISGDPDDKKSKASELFNRLMKKGYSPYWYDGKALRIRSQGVKEVNYFFLTENHLHNYNKIDSENNG
jgi:FkbM family methyltransferase